MNESALPVDHQRVVAAVRQGTGPAGTRAAIGAVSARGTQVRANGNRCGKLTDPAAHGRQRSRPDGRFTLLP
ncbi:hypothetical protein [Streptomyces sp. ID05-47C]|uniref:hypothetical protein n=1 Tax=Streptomyces sp. ID05-47C TaxID=3028665 RepID=UPI0029B79973|nr:hypothetical protein [Streptomyces sp. ID05-47C]MDX3568592.1 hypothetical protein [Streptomyces sp. ID05-47C]